jgi:hypothetical protein
MPNDAAALDEGKPNHMIVWLDQNIGNPDEYVHLKKAFSSIADPKNEDPVNLIDTDYDKLLRTVGATSVKFEGVWFLLAAFTNAELCVKFLQENQDKRIFLITSGQMGRAVMPSIMLNCKNIFIDSVKNEPYSFIYVFCHDIGRQRDWIFKYADYIKAFTFDTDLLVRMIRDIADYFVEEGERLMNGNPPDYSAAYNRLSGAYTLYDRYRTMEKVALKKEFDKVNELLERAERGMKSSSEDND